MTSTPKYAQFLLSSRRNTNPAILQKLGDGVPEVKRADNEQRSHGGFRGGGFAGRGLSAAGLVRGGAPKTNGDA